MSRLIQAFALNQETFSIKFTILAIPVLHSGLFALKRRLRVKTNISCYNHKQNKSSKPLLRIIFSCLITFGSNLVLDSLKWADYCKFKGLVSYKSFDFFFFL